MSLYQIEPGPCLALQRGPEGEVYMDEFWERATQILNQWRACHPGDSDGSASAGTQSLAPRNMYDRHAY